MEETLRIERMGNGAEAVGRLASGKAVFVAGGAPGDEALLPLGKAADKSSAVIKCIEERKTGNREFLAAEETLRRTIAEMRLPEADVFLAEFLPAYEQSLDELRGEDGNG